MCDDESPGALFGAICSFGVPLAPKKTIVPKNLRPNGGMQ